MSRVCGSFWAVQELRLALKVSVGCRVEPYKKGVHGIWIHIGDEVTFFSIMKTKLVSNFDPGLGFR